MKEARGQNKPFLNALLLMCCCSFAIGQFLIFKNQSERQAIEMLTVRITIRATQIRDVVLRTYPFL